ncbi:HlyD family type I secretion periplasmic adaptor subunit [Thalassospira xiamenensis]|uniref:Membrane fusion protein (MFP) family protein n=1 Tax=Thalassospira xiamenensis TaxID=220697 RepID=A0A285TTY0_9PROT|nr:HlyD family type I secretion periplasmic adaptor subunit [Thalassospira xiamenensis]SOC24694.1 HlyD family secretion protein [Thalassospira xiamenensis]
MHKDESVSDIPKMLGLQQTFRRGWFCIGIFILIFGVWSTFVPLARSTVAPGSVSPEGSRRTIQHLEGGIVRAILVREGDKVRAGDVVVELEDVKARTDYSTQQAKLWQYLAEHGRLRAERDNSEEIRFDPLLLKQVTNSQTIRDALEAQRAIFISGQNAISTQKDILIKREKQLEQQIAGFQIQNRSLKDQILLIEEEILDVQSLFDKGLERKSRLLSLKRTRAQIAGTLGANLTSIASAQEKIGQTRLEIVQLNTDRLDEINERLAELEAQIIDSKTKISEASDTLERTNIHAPVDGIVINQKVKTIGGVIGSAEPLLDIVPTNEELVVEAQVSPLDIDAVRAGLSADVFLSAYSRRNTPSIPGTVAWVSADAQATEDGKKTYFLVRILISRDVLAGVPKHVKLYPGMQAEVFIRTGDRTFLDYLLEPLLQSLDRSFTEM